MDTSEHTTTLDLFTKRCTRCDERKPFESFYWKRPGKLMACCKRCSDALRAKKTDAIANMLPPQNQAWSPAEDEILRSLYLSHTRAEIGEIVGRTEKSVRSRCYTLRLNTKAPKRWSRQEVQILREAYAEGDLPREFLTELAARLGRTRHSVALKAGELGISDKHRTFGGRKDKRVYKGDHEALRAHMSECAKRRIQENGHPKGALGMTHTKETRRILAEHTRRRATEMTPIEQAIRTAKAIATKIERYGNGSRPPIAENVYSRCKRGKRADLGGQFFRSRWEANYARYLNFLITQGSIQSWEYEPKTFLFEGVTRGVISYTPDFLVTETDGSTAWHEVKGWMDDKSKARLARMAKFYPDEKIIVIGPPEYKAISKFSRLIPGWENDRETLTEEAN
jgi:hypothetical protein